MSVVCNRFDDLGKADSARTYRLGIMGGTFDPIHIGHLAVAEQAHDAYDLDGVIFIPTGNPAFKQAQQVTPADVRLQMCRAAIEGNSHFDVSSIEVDRKGVTYTADTLRQLRAHYSENVDLYFITGADAVMSIIKWHESSVIAGLAHLIAVTRPGFVMSDEYKCELTEHSAFDVTYFEATALSVSSSMLRERVHDGKSISYLTPRAVEELICRYKLYVDDADGDADNVCCLCAGDDDVSFEYDEEEMKKVPPMSDDVFGDEMFKEMKDELKGRVSEKRYRHSKGVAKTAAHLAKIYGYDQDQARMAGILHDWDKSLSADEERRRVIEFNVEVSPKVADDMPWLLHGPTGAAALKHEHPEFGDEVFQAIARHTSGAKDMSPLDCIIYIADMIEPNRRYSDIAPVDDLRDLIGKIPLRELYFRAFKTTLQHLVDHNRQLNPETAEIWNALMWEYGKVKDMGRM